MRKSHHHLVSPRATDSSKSARSRASAALKSKRFRKTVKRKRGTLPVQKGDRLFESLGKTIYVYGRHHFLVKSSSEKGVWHCVDLGYIDVDWPEGGCTCDGFSVRKTCSHYRAVLNLYE